MQHHSRTFEIRPFAINNRASDQQKFVRRKWPPDRIAKSNMMTLRVPDRCNRLQRAKKGRIKALHAAGYGPFVERTQPRKVVALIRRVHPVGQEPSCHTFGEISPFERGPLLRNEPFSKPQE